MRIFVVVSLVSGIGGLTSLPLWTVQEVVVRGAVRVPVEDIIERAAIPADQNVFWLSAGAVRERVLKDPRIESVRVHRRLPSWVILDISERKPYAVLMIGGRSYAIDPKGNILFRLEASAAVEGETGAELSMASELPVVRGAFPGLDSASRIDPRSARDIYRTLSAMVALLPGRTLQLEWRPDGAMELLVDDVMAVRIGSAEDLGAKMDALGHLIKDVGARLAQVEYVDVRIPEYPVLKWRPGT